MCQFPLFETISIRDGIIQNLAFHQARFNDACLNYFKVDPFLNLSEVIIVPDLFKQGVVRCRVDYNAVDYKVNFYPYSPREITQFKLVNTIDLNYQFKYSDRAFFQSLPQIENSEYIIVNNGRISDATIGNLLFLKQGRWFSPKNYLLKGTQLSFLLAQDCVDLIEIYPENLADFEQIMLINALNPFDPTRALPIQAVHF